MKILTWPKTTAMQVFKRLDLMTKFSQCNSVRTSDLTTKLYGYVADVDVTTNRIYLRA